ncbi:HNH endonuclease [Nonomuraea typhae]|uniref:HNH endonuclease n=1 Tax=Nonomuraea typhae TaxID=2603600 RepID=UPI0012F8116D|nr:HNH endonuclease [Nonomuraea typhae]
MAISKRLRAEILRRDNSTCQKCGAKAPKVPLVIDHVTPVALGGSDEPTNLQTLCEPCNSGKSATPPDAAVVAQVAKDANRWSKAMLAAADRMLAAHGAQSEVYQQIERWWQDARGGRYASLPPGWERSIDNFLAAGLPVQIIRESVEIALSRQRNDPWKYFCAVAWSKVRDLQEAARSLVAKVGDEDEEDEDYDPDLDPQLAPGRESLAATILGTLAESSADLEARIEWERTWLEDAESVPRSKLIIEAAQTAVGHASWDSFRLMTAAKHLLGFLPKDEVREARSEAIAKIEEQRGPGEPERESLVVIETVRLFRLRRALTYLEALPEEEFGEWMAYASAWYGPASPWHPEAELPAEENILYAAKVARHIKEGGFYWHMCLGAGTRIPRCPRRAAYRVFFNELGCCKADSEQQDHVLHGFCHQHLEDSVDHGWVAPNERHLTIRDFEELDDA